VKKEDLMKNRIKISFSIMVFLAVCINVYSQVEIKEYQGEKLSPFDRSYDNSINGPQKVDINKYRLIVNGKIQKALQLNYTQVLTLPSVTRAITLNCIEGWGEHLLFKGVRIADIVKSTTIDKDVQTVVFYAVDGYSSSLSYKYVLDNDIMLAYEINGIKLDDKRGFPFQVVAESKFGYKWVKWVTRIEFSDKPYEGYWEQRGYDNEADIY
jgi:DMSO/TMAO reductase YedYZ molybdopterin-dependent catalytic subunit